MRFYYRAILILEVRVGPSASISNEHDHVTGPNIKLLMKCHQVTVVQTPDLLFRATIYLTQVPGGHHYII